MQDSAPSWVGKRSPRHVHWVLLDVLLAAALMLAITVPAVTHLPAQAGVDPVVVGAFCTGGALSVALRRVWPVPAVVLMLICLAALVVMGHERDPLRAPGLLIPPLVLYTVAARLPRWQAVTALTVAGLVVLSAGIAVARHPWPDAENGDRSVPSELLAVAGLSAAA